ncbi:hypothetical protein BDF20DRAFT_107497 [Mycotypha africana]|uniref:uncharacterized protein n=1 Tax=Mycotypha africana TaxID=64632 RepID=UPI0023001957|nr:uncharacterized protein BDF20DRAFT_107497 [Mycotypha africana]KAI8970151.1 hypothetical protein BDF20DRAFT_107497 [Mycotypha africana]
MVLIKKEETYNFNEALTERISFLFTFHCSNTSSSFPSPSYLFLFNKPLMSNSSTVAKESQVSETTAENIGTNVVPRATSATSLPVESKSIEDNVSEENQLPLDTDTQRSTDTTNNATTTKTQKNSLIDEKEPRDTDIGTESTLAQQSDDEQEESNSMRNDVKTAQEDKDDSETFEETMSEAENKRTPEFPVFDEENDDFTISNDETNVHDNDDDFDEFGEFNDEFVDATPNAVGDDDDFGDFDDFEQTPDVLAPEKDPTEKATILEEDAQSNTPTAVELYIDVMMNRPNEVKQFMTNYLTQLWKSSRESEQERDVLESEEPAETLDMDNTSVEPNILATASRYIIKQRK